MTERDDSGRHGVQHSVRADKRRASFRRRLAISVFLVLLGLGIVTARGLLSDRPVMRDPVLVVENRGSREVTAITIHETPRGAAGASPVTSRIGRPGPGERVVFGCGRDPRLVIEYTANGVETSYVSDAALGAGEVWVISLGEEGRPTARYGKPEEARERVGSVATPLAPRPF